MDSFTNVILSRSRILIERKRYGEALHTLSYSDHPTSLKWRSKLEAISGLKTPIRQKSHGLKFTIALAFFISALIMLVALTDQNRVIPVLPRNINMPFLLIATVIGFLITCWIAYIVDKRMFEGEKQKIFEEQSRRYAIDTRRGDWDDNICDALIQRRLAVGMSFDMVRLSQGDPPDIDQQETTAKSHKERWVYGVRRKNATYISFKDGVVTAIKRTGID